MRQLQLTSVTIGAPNPRELARFYARLLDAEIVADEPPAPGDPPAAGWAQVHSSGLRLNFEFEASWRPIVWPSQADGQHIPQHLDILVDDLDAAVAWAEECGAGLARHQPQADVRVMIDPAGHPFCLFVSGE